MLSFPYDVLVLSGGTSTLFHVRGPQDLTVLAETRDDALGEVMDKVGRLLGAPVWELAPHARNPVAFTPPLSKSSPRKRAAALAAPFFTFSGLKTQVGRAVDWNWDDAPTLKDASYARDVAAGFQSAALEHVRVQTARARRLAGTHRLPLALAGGCALGVALRRAFPSAVAAVPAWCPDNGAMIAWAAFEGATVPFPSYLDNVNAERWKKKLEEMKNE